MKVSIEIDCTPAEARQFLGLPDLAPMQAAISAEMEKRMMAHIENFTPEGLLRTWFAAVPQNGDWTREMFSALFAGSGIPKESPSKRESRS